MKQTDLKRFSSQANAILARLRQGPATNRELSQIALKYTGRISDLRKSGFNITVSPLGKRGLTLYSLEG